MLNESINTPVQMYAPPDTRISSEYVRLAAGPPQLELFSNVKQMHGAKQNTQGVQTAATNDVVYPIGLTQAFALPQNKAIMALTELGSRRNFMYPAKTTGALTLSRAMIWGPNLLRVLYAWWDAQNNPALLDKNSSSVSNLLLSSGEDPALEPGYDNVWLNLESDMFDRSFGLVLLIHDNHERGYAATYFENCYVMSYNVGYDANNLLMFESVQMLYERQVPVKLSDQVSIEETNVWRS